MFYKNIYNKTISMKRNKEIDSKVYLALLEYFSKTVTEENNELSDTENQLIDFVLGENIDEADGNEILNRFMSVINSGKRKLVTAAVLTTLMANPSFSNAMEKAPDNVKNQISQIMGDNDSQSTKSDKTLDTQKDVGGNYKSKDAAFTINFYNNFKSGSYEIDSEEAYAKLEELKNFLGQNKNNKFKINIIASESQVPNQAGFKVGELANKRAQVMNQLVNNFISNNQLGDMDVKMNTNVGNVPWDGKNKNDKKYTKDQYVVLEVEVASVTPCELSFSEQGKQAQADKDYVAYKQSLEGGGSLTMTTGSIPDRMQILKDGKVIADTDYFVDKAHSYREWKYVPMYVGSLTELLVTKPNSSAIKGVKQIKHFEDFNELIKFMMTGTKPSYDYKKDNRTEIIEGLQKLSNLWKKGQRDFVFYSMKKGTLSFAIEQGKTGEVKVFSPIGSTGFGLAGNCN